jgi:hypothetical protein
MSNEARRERAHRATLAYDEFINPMVDMLREEYLAALSELAVNEPWEAGKMTKLAVAQRVINKVDQHMKSIILDGEDVARKMSRAQEIMELPEAKRKWLNFAPY